MKRLVLKLTDMVITSVWNMRANTGVLGTKRPTQTQTRTPTQTQSRFNFLSFISIDLPEVFRSTRLSRVVCISLLSTTTTTTRFESMFSRSHSRFLRIFYTKGPFLEQTKNFVMKSKKGRSFYPLLCCARTRTRTRPRTHERDRAFRDDDTDARTRTRARIKFVDAFDACAFQSPRVDTRGGGETQNVFYDENERGRRREKDYERQRSVVVFSRL